MENSFIDNSYIVAPILSMIGGAIITWYLLPVIISISYAKGLGDHPRKKRKIHSSFTPNLGGIAFYFGFIITLLLSGYVNTVWGPYVLIGLTFLCLSGIKDDIVELSPQKKLVLQGIAVFLTILGGNTVITNLGGVFGLTHIPYWVGILLTAFTMVVIINAYNLIDGIDGLAGSIGLLTLLFFGSWFWFSGLTSYSVLAFSGVGILGAFLWFNFQPASIFMGDTGSQIIGFILAFLAVSFVQKGITATYPVPFQNEVPILVLSVLIVPLYDTLRVFIMRALKNRSPFKADRLHVHHQLLDFGFSHNTACYIIAGFNIALIGFTILLNGLNLNVLLGIVLAVSVIFFPTTGFKRELLARLGVRMPSPRYINLLERRYGIKTTKELVEEGRDESEREKIAV